MANTLPTFFRRFQVFAAFQFNKKTKIIEPVQITLGFNGPVELESGMVLNLADVDAWIDTVKITTAKKTYPDHWSFCRFVKKNLNQIIECQKLSEIRFSFHNLTVNFQGTDVFLIWNRQAVVQSEKLKCISAVTLTTRLTKTIWPPINHTDLAKLNKALSTVKLDKLAFKTSHLEFVSFEYMDPILGSKLRILGKN